MSGITDDPSSGPEHGDVFVPDLFALPDLGGPERGDPLLPGDTGNLPGDTDSGVGPSSGPDPGVGTDPDLSVASNILSDLLSDLSIMNVGNAPGVPDTGLPTM